MNNTEKDFIIEIIRFNTNKEKIEELIKSNKINWINVLGFISYHRIAGLVYEKMNNMLGDIQDVMTKEDNPHNDD